MKHELKSLLATTTGCLAGLLLTGQAALAGPMNIRLHVVIHDDVPAPVVQRLDADYLQPWLLEMERTTGREVELHTSRNLPGITDIAYRQVDRKFALSSLARLNEQFWRQRRDGAWNYRVDKTLLVVQGTVAPSDASGNELVGEARFQGDAAWASVQTFSAVGHELGHLFGATHENAEVLYNGWFCETYTYPARLNVRSNCYRYSDSNREAIRAYLSEAP
jgi:hypothetical protein